VVVNRRERREVTAADAVQDALRQPARGGSIPAKTQRGSTSWALATSDVNDAVIP
jgi:hypothetical protein